MKNKMLMRLATLCLCAGLVGGSALAAGKMYKNITVQYDNIKLVIDGVTITPKDANGSTVEPFIYNGTTYLPVRAVGNALGKQVSWDGNTKTVYLGDNLGLKTYLVDVCLPYETSGFYAETFKMGGETYGRGFKQYGAPWNFALFNLNGHYKTLEFDMGHIDGSGMAPGTYEFYLDGQLAKTVSMDAEDRVQHITIPLNYALQMKIVPIESADVAYGFANCILS